MPLMILIYAAVLIFVAGNLYRIVRIARMPAHLRWELYPIPHGTRPQRLHGGSYFEESEWWTQRPPSSRTSELAYILREAVLLKGVWDAHRALWLWSWLMHLGLYSLVLATLLTSIAAVRRADELVAAATFVAWVAMVSGGSGTLGILALRGINRRLRPYTSRGTVLNLLLLAAVFGTGLACLISDPGAVGNMIALARSLLGLGDATALSNTATAHVAIVASFLVYFPFTHMTHAYMKYFTYHAVRWDDVASAHDPQSADTLARNLSRPVSWSAAHVGSKGRTWREVVSAEAESERNV